MRGGRIKNLHRPPPDKKRIPQNGQPPYGKSFYKMSKNNIQIYLLLIKYQRVMKQILKEKRSAGQPKKYNELTFVYGGVRLPISWKGTDKLKEYKRRMNEVIKELV